MLGIQKRSVLSVLFFICLPPWPEYQHSEGSSQPLLFLCVCVGASQVVPVVKNLPPTAGDVKDSGLIPGSGRSPGGGHGNPLQCSCLENPTDRGAWLATVHGVAKSRARLKRLSVHIHTLPVGSGVPTLALCTPHVRALTKS